MRDDFNANMARARWAVRRWAGFPVATTPRPHVLVGPDVVTRRGFRTGEAKLAFMAGDIHCAVEVPAWVQEKLARDPDRDPRPASTTGGPGEAARRPLRLTHAGRGKQEFVTDRGSRVLPAWWVQGPETDGPLWILAPEVDCWQPAAAAGGPAPDPRPVGQVLWPVELGADDRSAVVPWLGSHRTVETFPRAELVESPTAVSAVAIRRDMGFRGAVTAIGIRHDVRVCFAEPLDGRVFVDLDGHAVQVIAATASASLVAPSGSAGRFAPQTRPRPEENPPDDGAF